MPAPPDVTLELLGHAVKLATRPNRGFNLNQQLAKKAFERGPRFVLLLVVKRAFLDKAAMSANDPIADIGSLSCCRSEVGFSLYQSARLSNHSKALV
jgi:hypothetical protein